MEKKFTKRNAITTLLTLSEVKADPRLVAYCENELKLLDKKNVSGEKAKTKTQEANDIIKAEILNWYPDGEKFTCSNLQKSCPACAELSTPKISALVNQMVGDGLLIKTTEKRVSYFALA
jgi:hypothetical protein